ncbi:Glucose/arabinose dehydrogenase, beta-propeller fold [Haladaptatus litoreus]|uniref:Glucose/arabinose dehydrogenase, beta-propeller fold n=1 Tax=Haladaptatus litoreus TaxID=553468 RepID=A0A1N7E066_9EURY|nr:PQQ-dependent sugar dehydrogenase [Haladaptatus litoreus]SIR81507.1 Glucose/arabinose dehydrogenase, beta-propeller fold [Haladaptatus litoreus]
MPHSTRRKVLASTGVLLSVGVVTGDTTSGADPETTSSPIRELDGRVAQQNSAVEAVATDLEVPWGTDFAPDGTLYFTERTGRVNRLGSDGVELLAEIDDTNVVGEGGLLGLALHPEFPTTQTVFLFQTYEDDGISQRILRYRLVDGELEREAVIFDGIPGAQRHTGGRLTFGPDGYLYATVGDTDDPEMAQNLETLHGSILRLEPDGSVPDCERAVFSYGHRNPEGLAFHPETGVLYSTEHGPDTDDEINRIEEGNNYGWPTVTGESDDPAFTDPLASYTPAIAPASAAFYDGAFYFGALAGEHLHRVTFGSDGRTVESDDRLFEGEFGRIRSVIAGSDGLYFATSNRDGRGSPGNADDRILRWTP